MYYLAMHKITECQHELPLCSKNLHSVPKKKEDKIPCKNDNVLILTKIPSGYYGDN